MLVPLNSIDPSQVYGAASEAPSQHLSHRQNLPSTTTLSFLVCGPFPRSGVESIVVVACTLWSPRVLLHVRVLLFPWRSHFLCRGA